MSLAVCPLAQYTAFGAALAFELSIGVFTYRIIKGSRRRWTKRGLLFFIVASVVANAYYYRVWPFLFDWLMPVFATLALPLALALFAEEFGALEKITEQRRKRAEKTMHQTEAAEVIAEPTEAATKTAQVQRLADEHPEWNRARLAQEVGCSASTVTRALDEHQNKHRTKGE